MIPTRNKTFRALKLSNLENFMALKLPNLESFRALKASNLATGTTSLSTTFCKIQMEITGQFKDALTRHANEGVWSYARPAQELLNSNSEFNHPPSATPAFLFHTCDLLRIIQNFDKKRMYNFWQLWIAFLLDYRSLSSKALLPTHMTSITTSQSTRTTIFSMYSTFQHSGSRLPSWLLVISFMNLP